MPSKMCPAAHIDCETLDWMPMCNGVTITTDAIGCIRPSRQVPIAPEPVNCPMCNKHGQHNQVAAAIADMPIEEFKANCEKLKALPFSENWSERDNHYFLKGYAKGCEKMKTAILTAVKELLDPEHCTESITAGDVISTIEQTEV
jgi:hypothetical protein